MKKKIIATLMVTMLVIVAAFMFAGCSGKNDTGTASVPDMPNSVKEITSQSQLSGGVTVVNYQAIVKADVDWSTLSANDQQKIIEYTFAEARKEATDNAVPYYNILGMSEGTADQESQILFMFDQANNKVTIYTDGQPSGSIDAPAAS